MTFPFAAMETKWKLLGMRLNFWKCFETGEIMHTTDSVWIATEIRNLYHP